MSATAERLWELVEPYVAAEGIELDDLEIVGTGPGTIVRITVDVSAGSADTASGAEPASVDVDHLAGLSRRLSRLLDEADPVSGSYTLEVTSPGLERKLRRPRHYEKSVGREVKVKTVRPVDGERQHRGILAEVGPDEFVVEVGGGPRRFEYADVTSARTVFEWVKSPKPGKRQ